MLGPPIVHQWQGMDRERGKVFDPKVVRRLWAYLTPYKLHMFVSFALIVVYAGSQVLGPYLLKVAIDEYLVKTQDLRGLTVISIGYLLNLLVALGTQAQQTYAMAQVAQNGLNKMRDDLFRKINELSLSYHDTHESGVTMSRIVNDVAVFQELLTQGVVHLLADCLTLVGIIFVMWTMSPKLALYAFSVIPIMVIATVLYTARARNAF